MAVWQAHKSAFSGRSDVGVWLDSHDNVEDLAPDLEDLSAVALNFPKFTDGRAYSAAALLRSRYGFKGEIRAIGDVLRDQFFFMQRCGFDAIQPKAGKYSDAQLEESLASLKDFSAPYQAAVDQPEPLFRRAQRAPERGAHAPNQNPKLDDPALLASLDSKTAQLKADLAAWAAELPAITMANSLGAEDMVLTDVIATGLPIEIFSLDTGRLPSKPTT
jgi:uncharacterized protein (DUF934 family)